MKKAVIFDVGSVLVTLCWEKYLTAFDYDDKTREALTNAIIKSKQWIESDCKDIPYEEWVQSFVENAPELEREIRLVCDRIEESVIPFDYTLKWLEYYRKQGCQLYYLSNYPRGLLEKTRGVLSFLEDFDGGIFSFQECLKKPQEEIYLRLFRRYNIDPRETLFFDDRLENVEMGNKLGLKAILFTPEIARQELRLNELLQGKAKNMTKVVKFGGSSLASAEQFQKVKKIIERDSNNRYIVPSAPGKRFEEDEKITDLLYQCYASTLEGENFDRKWEEIQGRYEEIIQGLGLKLSLREEFQQIRKNFTAQLGVEYAASRGEYLNGKILAEYLHCEFVDAAQVIAFGADRKYDPKKTKELMKKRLEHVERAVIPGFYGSLADGRIKTFPRGGSDITGAIVASAMGADIYENWTDVSGFLVADPRIVENPQPIEIITYRELRELSYMGATVLQEDSIFPVQQYGIPIHIRNTNEPEDAGTFIVEHACREGKYAITGVTGKKDFVALTLEKMKMKSDVGFCRAVTDIFARHGIPIEHMPSGIDALSVFVHQSKFEKKAEKVLADIQREIQPAHMELESEIALIAVVGRSMKATKGIAGRSFMALARAGVNVKMINQGPRELNIIIGVKNEDFEASIQAIYSSFVKEKEAGHCSPI